MECKEIKKVSIEDKKFESYLKENISNYLSDIKPPSGLFLKIQKAIKNQTEFQEIPEKINFFQSLVQIVPQLCFRLVTVLICISLFVSVFNSILNLN